MRLRNVALVVASGLAAFLAVGVAVTELLRPSIEFSLFVGLPAGVVAGVLVSAGVYLGLGDETSTGRRRVALAAGAFGGVFLAVLLVAAGLFGLGTLTALAFATLSGVAAAVATSVRSS
ncbi:hypothetical protein SAMN05216559_3655 [Halomicrobium zhouii]|uniref:DUF8147 domain-containing protein n=1 Tax=Halomicrobium zhouii TaxID=767519 RepID=A0A1I6M319_9EURY|nr:hypothetical protein [Halomicrobium zhouii]SFS10076.1 hypothetical protein SAMN05216559_3655 [Halomicrobium zhouii]